MSINYENKLNFKNAKMREIFGGKYAIFPSRLQFIQYTRSRAKLQVER